MKIDGRYEEHPVFTAPADQDARIWRYLDFTKLVSLLETRRLFFARANTFDDPFEGSYSQFNVTTRPSLYKEAMSEERLSTFLANQASITSQFRRWTFINCWNLSERESAALWGLYVPPSGGVAIRSSFRRLTESFGLTEPLPEDKDPTRIYIGQVQYVDYENDWIPEGNSMWPFVHKRHSFEFESEIRAVVQKLPHDDGIDGDGPIDFTQPDLPGLEVAVDLETLIETIHVAPTAPAWFADLVSAVVGRYGLAVPVSQSSLSGSPVY